MVNEPHVTSRYIGLPTVLRTVLHTFRLAELRERERERGTETTLRGIETGQSGEHWKHLKGDVGKTSDRLGGEHNYGLFRAHRCHLELN